MLLIAPNPLTIDPDINAPTVVTDDVVILEPRVPADNTVVPAMSYPFPDATESPDDDCSGPPSAPFTVNVTSVPAPAPSMSSPAFWLDALGD